jgi:hypothetical protein
MRFLAHDGFVSFGVGARPTPWMKPRCVFMAADWRPWRVLWTSGVPVARQQKLT